MHNETPQAMHPGGPQGGGYPSPQQHQQQAYGGSGGGSVNVFNPAAFKQQPQQHPQQHAQQHAQQPPQQHHHQAPVGAGGYGSPYGGQPTPYGGVPVPPPAMDFAGGLENVVNSQAFSMGVGMGQQYLSANVQRYTPWFTAAWHGLKYYFAVNHHYVRRKLLTLLFPFRKRQWRREVKDDVGHASTGADNGQGAGAGGRPTHYQIPMLDENAPDLYLPLMAFVTYVVVTGYAKGAKNSFTPEVLVDVTSSCLVTQLLEILAVRLGLYLLQAPATLLDLLAVTGYKYVALNVNMLLGLALGPRVYMLAMLYTGLAMAYFALKTFAQAVRLAGPRDLAQAPVRVELVVLGFALLQFFSVWWLGYSGDLQQRQ